MGHKLIADQHVTQYTVNTGISPNLLYPVPGKTEHAILGRVITKLSDCAWLQDLQIAGTDHTFADYPLWQLVYQVSHREQ